MDISFEKGREGGKKKFSFNFVKSVYKKILAEALKRRDHLSNRDGLERGEREEEEEEEEMGVELVYYSKIDGFKLEPNDWKRPLTGRNAEHMEVLILKFRNDVWIIPESYPKGRK